MGIVRAAPMVNTTVFGLFRTWQRTNTAA